MNSGSERLGESAPVVLRLELDYRQAKWKQIVRGNGLLITQDISFSTSLNYAADALNEVTWPNECADRMEICLSHMATGQGVWILCFIGPVEIPASMLQVLCKIASSLPVL